MLVMRCCWCKPGVVHAKSALLHRTHVDASGDLRQCAPSLDNALAGVATNEAKAAQCTCIACDPTPVRVHAKLPILECVPLVLLKKVS